MTIAFSLLWNTNESHLSELRPYGILQCIGLQMALQPVTMGVPPFAHVIQYAGSLDAYIHFTLDVLQRA